MYAIVEIAGHQFKVSKDLKVYVNRLASEEGSKVSFDKVLLLDDNGSITLGAPAIEGASVEAKVLQHLKGDKVIVFKKKRRKGYKKRNGHRQYLTQIVIEGISTSAPKKAAPKKAAAEVVATEEVAVPKVKKAPKAKKEDSPNFKQKKRPDNVVFDEKSQSYNASILPYGTNIGAPAITSNDLSTWKNRGISGFNHILKSKIEDIKQEYSSLVKTYETNEILYNAKYEFEPIIGEIYHLYEKENTNENFLSIIPPETWKRKHLGSFQLNSEKVWKEIKNENVRAKEAITTINY